MHTPVDLETLLHIPPVVLARMSAEECLRYNAIPLAFDETTNTLTVATPFPDDLVALDTLRHATRYTIHFVKTNETDFHEAFKHIHSCWMWKHMWDRLCAEMHDTRIRSRLINFLRGCKHKWNAWRSPEGFYYAVDTAPLENRVQSFLLMSGALLHAKEFEISWDEKQGRIHIHCDGGEVYETDIPQPMACTLVRQFRPELMPEKRELYFGGGKYQTIRCSGEVQHVRIAFDPLYHEAYIGVGSNIDPEEHIPAAFRKLAETDGIHLKKDACLSSVYRTPALERPKQPEYCNTVWKVYSQFPPHALQYDVLRRIEADCGRVRTEDKFAARTIDLDLLLYGMEEFEDDSLHLPSPEISTRAFVAVPLVELAPDLRLPGMQERLANLPVVTEAGAMRKDESIRQALQIILDVCPETIEKTEGQTT